MTTTQHAPAIDTEVARPRPSFWHKIVSKQAFWVTLAVSSPRSPFL